jgi:hypothetical protein
VQALTGLGIPHLAMIDFKGVIEITNVIGGVEVCVARPINDRYSKLRLDAGWHTLKGEDALAFLRTRSSIGDGSDLSRITNQQTYMASLVRTLKGQNALTNPVRLFQLANAAADNMTLSRGLTDLNVIAQLAQQINKVDLDNITFLQLPVYDLAGRYEGRLGLIEEDAQFLFDKLIADEPLILAEANPGSGAVVITPSPTASSEPSPTASSEPSPTASSEPSPTASPGGGTASSSTATPNADATTETQVDPTPEPTAEPLPDWVRGTTGSTTSCTR